MMLIQCSCTVYLNIMQLHCISVATQLLSSVPL
uniref:Uncharacterized protein n=1 Tax=Anguilla anguilla TaxID=7936 RepID=A0A0E9SMA5_ANGAN